jgi:hypothetical protein
MKPETGKSSTLSLNLTRDGLVANATPSCFTPGKETRYPLYRRLGVPLGQPLAGHRVFQFRLEQNIDRGLRSSWFLRHVTSQTALQKEPKVSQNTYYHSLVNKFGIVQQFILFALFVPMTSNSPTFKLRWRFAYSKSPPHLSRCLKGRNVIPSI